MVSGSAEDAARRVRRIDGRLGLASLRVSLSPRTLITYARDHLVVRTPSQPDLRDGNALDLERPPAVREIPAWRERYERTVGMVGASHVRLRWEIGLPGDAPPAVPRPDPELAAACEAVRLTLEPRRALLLDELVEPRRAPVTFVPVAPPSAAPGGPVDRRWHAATVLYRYVEGETPDDWRAVSGRSVAWTVEVQRELAIADRAQVWLAMRYGAPVGRLTIAHDRQGLAVVEDVIVHPAHRRCGIASALAHEAIARHLDVHPGTRVGVVAEPGGTAERLARRLGFLPHADLWVASGSAGVDAT